MPDTKIWVTSDWHFGHDREFIWKPREFNSVEEMNEAIVERHNALVAPDDIVYVLGDLMLGSADNIKYIKRMNGWLRIVRGNHDTDNRVLAYMSLPKFMTIGDALTLKYKQHHFYFSHYPTLTGNLEKESLKQMTLNLYGHTHQKTNFYMDMPYMFHVGVDSHNCCPVLLDDIIDEMYSKVEECKAFLDVEQKTPAVAKVEHTKQLMKKNWDLFVYEMSHCDRCVWQGNECPGPTPWKVPECPHGLKYKRDPPDGGYYG